MFATTKICNFVYFLVKIHSRYIFLSIHLPSFDLNQSVSEEMHGTTCLTGISQYRLFGRQSQTVDITSCRLNVYKRIQSSPSLIITISHLANESKPSWLS